MCTYVLCIWWLCICGSNVSGGEHVGLNTKVGFACGSSPLPVLLACLGLSLPPGSSLSFSPNTQELRRRDQQLSHKGVKASGSQFIHSSLTTTRLIWKKMTLNVQRRANLQGSPNKHSAWHLRHQDNRDPVVASVYLSL